MTPKQEERIRTKIKKIRAALAADKKRWGGYHHDGQGLRYRPPSLYMELGDFSGGLRYLNWFQKTFPDDAGYPDFLFEWTVILFKTGRAKQAEGKAFDTFRRNTYLFDAFFERPIQAMDKWEGSNLETQVFAAEHFGYSKHQEGLADFATWLENYLATAKFQAAKTTFIAIRKQLITKSDSEQRGRLISREQDLVLEPI